LSVRASIASCRAHNARGRVSLRRRHARRDGRRIVAVNSLAASEPSRRSDARARSTSDVHMGKHSHVVPGTAVSAHNACVQTVSTRIKQGRNRTRVSSERTAREGASSDASPDDASARASTCSLVRDLVGRSERPAGRVVVVDRQHRRRVLSSSSSSSSSLRTHPVVVLSAVPPAHRSVGSVRSVYPVWFVARLRRAPFACVVVPCAA